MVDVMGSEFEDKVALRYEGRHELKGVLGGHAYPMFWIDGAAEDSLSKYEDGISNAEKKIDLNDVKGFCREFFNRHPEYFIEPFIHSETEKFLTNIPEGYQSKLTEIFQTWNKEREKVEAEIESEKDTHAPGSTTSEPEIVKFVQALIKGFLS
jgi:hypothetical protein